MAESRVFMPVFSAVGPNRTYTAYHPSSQFETRGATEHPSSQSGSGIPAQQMTYTAYHPSSQFETRSVTEQQMTYTAYHPNSTTN